MEGRGSRRRNMNMKKGGRNMARMGRQWRRQRRRGSAAGPQRKEEHESAEVKTLRLQ